MAPDATQHDDARHTITKAWLQVQRPVQAYVASFVPTQADADDVVQAVAMAMVDGFESYDRSRPLLTWVLGIARNKVTDHLRAAYRDKAIFKASSFEAIERAYLQAAEEAHEMSDALAHCLKKLSARRLESLKLRYVDGLKPARIADEMGCSVQVVYGLLQHARQSLRDCVEQQAPSIRLRADR